MSKLYYVVKINSVDKCMFERQMNATDAILNYFQSDVKAWNDSIEVYDNDDEYGNSE